MFRPPAPTSSFGKALSLYDRMYHATVKSIRSGHRNAVVALALSILQSMIMIGMFFLMFSIFGVRSAPLRGDYILYIMSGIFVFMIHSQTVGAISGAEGSTSPMMQHAPMNTAIAIGSAALGALYMQALSIGTILLLYHCAVTPISIEDPIGMIAMMLVSWFYGIAVGMVFYSLNPWFPTFSGMASRIYRRINMIASGKMFLANALPSAMLIMFDWNPLFHAIDQSRGFMFENYFPRNSSTIYPLYVSLAVLTVGLMGEFYTRLHASRSWGAAR